MTKLPHWINISPDCNPVLRSLVEAALGERIYVCSSCGIVIVAEAGKICPECQEPEAA